MKRQYNFRLGEGEAEAVREFLRERRKAVPLAVVGRIEPVAEGKPLGPEGFDVVEIPALSRAEDILAGSSSGRIQPGPAPGPVVGSTPTPATLFKKEPTREPDVKMGYVDYMKNLPKGWVLSERTPGTKCVYDGFGQCRRIFKKGRDY